MNAYVAAIKKISPFLRATKTLSCAKNRILFLRSVLILISLPGFNAIRHTPQGGKIQVTVHLVPEKGGLCLSVKDDGDGLAREYHQKIFDKFEQVKLKSEKGRVGSSGLGLTFCKMAVEAHGGKIWVESEGEGQGCTFRSLLPVCPP